MAALRGDLGPGIVEVTRSTYDLEHHVGQVAAYVASSDTAPSRWSLKKGSRWEVPVRQTVPRVGANRFGGRGLLLPGRATGSSNLQQDSCRGKLTVCRVHTTGVRLAKRWPKVLHSLGWSLFPVLVRGWRAFQRHDTGLKRADLTPLSSWNGDAHSRHHANVQLRQEESDRATEKATGARKLAIAISFPRRDQECFYSARGLCPDTSGGLVPLSHIPGGCR